MDRYFSGITALRYLRTPPQVLALYPPLAEPYQDSNHMKLVSSPLIEDILHTPLDCTVFHANKREAPSITATTFRILIFRSAVFGLAITAVTLHRRPTHF